MRWSKLTTEIANIPRRYIVIVVGAVLSLYGFFSFLVAFDELQPD